MAAAAALGAANWLFSKVVEKLSDELVNAYVSSSELGLNFEQIETDLMLAQGLLNAAQERDISNNLGLQGLLKKLGKKADEAVDALDELHYFIIREQLDGTQEAAMEVGDGLRGPALHGRHAIGNLISGLFFRGTKNDDNPRDAKRAKFDNDDQLSFDRVAMSNKIKSVIEGLHSVCAPVSKLLKINHATGEAASLKRPTTSSIITQDKLYGRDTIFSQTVNDITSGTYHAETLSVLPIVGPGGIGKTIFTQHLYNDKRIEAHFSVRVWVCVSTNFDVLKITQEILGCIPPSENEESNKANDTANLNQLQTSIAQRLKSKRFLIVLDDIWKCNSEDEWKKLLAPFTKGEARGNMVLVTTRFPRIADMVMKETRPIDLQGLEPGEFFRFFEACIFGENKLDNNELIEIARQIAKKLKGSPLAAKTVGRLLKNNLSHEHWVEVLEKNEWRNQENEDDIMPALKISYGYLPFHLKKCFSYCALFPEDHRFDELEIMRFWIAVGIIVSSDQNNKIEDTGLKYFDQLVDDGFLVKVDDWRGQHYVMHDLLHDLAQQVSKEECVNIRSSHVRADDIKPSIQHLSITIEYKHDNNFGEEMGKLKRRIDIPNLRTLMFFGDYSADFANILNDTFKEIKGLRVLFIVMNSPESLPHNFSELIHLQYLKIASRYSVELTLPSKLSRFYHLKFLDLEDWRGSHSLPKDISRLVNLRHFLAKKKLHSNVREVGRMVCLQELKKFCVKKEGDGFELRELGKLRELGGELSICNLEMVTTKGEANDAKLKSKSNLKKLRLVWGTEQRTTGYDVLDGLEPPPNLRALDIIHHSGSTGPSWLCGEIRIKMLEFLHLEGLSLATLPPFGQLPQLTTLILKNIAGIRQFGPDFGGVRDKSLLHLKKIEFDDMPELVEWAGVINCHVFPKLESICCFDCPNLSALPFSQCTGDRNTIWFPNLCRLQIVKCPKLSLPPMPHTSTLTYVSVGPEKNTHSLYIDRNELSINGYNGALALHNLDKVEEMAIRKVSHISLTDLQMLNSLRKLHVVRCDSMFSRELDDAVVLRSIQSLTLVSFPALSELIIEDSFEELVLQFPCSSSLHEVRIKNCENLILPVEDGGELRELTSLQSLKIEHCGKIFSRWSMGEEAAQIIKPFPTSLRELSIWNESSMQSMALLSNLTSLSRLALRSCYNLTMDGRELRELTSLQSLEISCCGKIFSRWSMGEEAAQIIKPFPTSLRELSIWNESSMQSMALLSNLTSLSRLELSFCHNLTMDGRELRELTSLQSLHIRSCGKILSRWSMGEAAQIIKPFPTSLRELRIYEEPSMQSMALVSNLTSLTHLELIDCDNLIMDGFDRLITSNLKMLEVYNEESETCSIAADLLSAVVRTNIIPAGSFQLEQLEVDSISVVLVAPICSHLSATLHKLSFNNDRWAESFTEEQEQALQLLTSLNELTFFECPSLQSLPEGLHLLRSLKEIQIWGSPEIRSLPREGVPTLLETLTICDISDDLKVQIENLKKTSRYLYVASY